MHYRLAAGCALLALSCGKSSSAPDQARDGGASDGDGGGGSNDAGDPGAPGRPPALARVEPAVGTATWLHEPVRFVFDEPITADTAAASQVTATLDGAAIAATVAVEAPDTLAVTLDPAARGLGALAVHVDATVAAPDGNATHASLDAAYTVAAWSGPAVDRGAATSPPSLAIDDRGGVVAAWTVGATGAHRVAVGRLVRGAWSAIGGELGDDAGTPAVALDGSGAPVVAWIDGGAGRVARWDGAAWTELASPGRGSHIALATGGDGAPIAAVFGATAAVRRLAGAAWQPIGSDPAIAGPMIGEPALAIGDAVAIGWIDAGRQLRVLRGGDAWTAIAPIALAAPPSGGDQLSLAARGPAIAVAYDAWAGSFGVVAAEVTGGATTWTPLGHLLDVDAAGDARGPAIAIDAAGAPIVAWTELIEGNQRGVVARYTDRWTIVGGRTFLLDARAAPSRVQLALAAGQAPVVGWLAGTTAQVERFNGPAVAGVGLAARSSIAGCAISPTAPPPLLSQTGCFTIAPPAAPVAHPGLVPYDVVAELWSDDSRKRRWIGLPDGAAAMTLSATGAWTAPPGTLMVKEFALETTPGDPATRRPVETRLLINDARLGWQGFSYRWTADGADATIQPDEAQTFDWPLDDGQTQAHVYPSRSHCLSCHEHSYGPLLGLRPIQLQRWFDYGGVIADQLPTLAALGIGPASDAAAVVSPHDPSATLERRMRGYLASNCAHCHNPDHIAIKDLRWTTPLADTRLCEAVVPGSPAQSVVYQKVSSRPGMPPLGTASVDPLAVALVGSWISQLTRCP